MWFLKYAFRSTPKWWKRWGRKTITDAKNNPTNSRGMLRVRLWIFGSKLRILASALWVTSITFGKIIHLHFLPLPWCKWVPVLLGKFPATDWRPVLEMMRAICLTSVMEVGDGLQPFGPYGLKKTKNIFRTFCSVNLFFVIQVGTFLQMWYTRWGCVWSRERSSRIVWQNRHRTFTRAAQKCKHFVKMHTQAANT